MYQPNNMKKRVKEKGLKNSLLVPLVLFLALLSSCSSLVTYVGDQYPATKTVDIYYSAHDVKKPFKVIGHMAYPDGGTSMVRSAFAAYGKKIGADAIVITGTENSKEGQAAIVNADALKYDQ